VREEGLRKFFGEFGPLTKCKYFFGKQVAFIEYGTPQESAKAQAETNGTDLEGQTLEVEFSGDKPAPKAPTQDAASTTVFCGNLGFRTSEEIIRGFFEQAGPVA
jgi:nucleolin